MIEFKNVAKIFYTKEIETYALSGVNLHIKKNDFVSIMGPSGCGKSTMLNIMGLLESPSSGEFYLDGEKIEDLSDKQLAKIRNLKLGFIFQSFHLIPSLNVLDNVKLPLLYRKEMSSKEIKERAISVLKKVGLANRINHYPFQLSGGQNQRVAIARAVIGNPEIVLADEPTGNLDSKMGSEIMDLLLKLHKEGTTIVIVTHDEKIAQKTDKIYNLFDGKLL